MPEIPINKCLSTYTPTGEREFDGFRYVKHVECFSHIKYKDHYATWQDAVDHMVSQGVKDIGWANGGVPYPKSVVIGGKCAHLDLRHGKFGENVTVSFYPEANVVICTDMS